MRMTRSWGAWQALCGALLAVSLPVWAAVPRTIAYQGKLTESNGVPLTGDHAVTIRLYDAATAGTTLWEEQHAISLTVLDNGVFSLVLGAVTPFGQGISFNAPLWLTIEVDGAGEFSPRQPLSSVGYALNADTLDGLDSTALLAAAAGQGDITAITAGTGLTGGGDVGAVTLNVDVGTTAGKIVQLDANGALPAVSGANLTGITASVDGASLTNLNASALTSGTVPDERLSANVSLLGPSIGAAELEAGAVEAGDIEVGDLPAHASVHQPGGSDALPTAASVSIGSANSAGASTSLARADHVHQGVHSLAASGQSQLTGDVTLSAGSNVTLTQSGQNIQVAAAGAAAGNRASAFASSAVELDDNQDTTLLSVTITKSQSSSAILLIATVQLNNTAGSKRETTLKLFRGATQLDGSYVTNHGGKNDPAGKLPVTLHAVDTTTSTGSLTYTLKASADEDEDMQATVRRLTALELP